MSEKILWIDDEIDLLKPHIVFLEKKGYQITPVNNVNEALELIDSEKFAITLIDENMPGISGLEAIPMIKEKDNSLKIIMVTKSEEEHIMEEAIGSQIADYILKPVNPNQILLSLKKNLQEDDLVEQKTILQYQQEFRNLSLELSYLRTYEDWADYYKKILNWEIKFDKVADNEFADLLLSQKEEANIQFSKFIERNYEDWLHSSNKPMMSHTLFKDRVKPEVEKGKVLLLMVDNLRYDQWKVIEPLFTKYYNKVSEDYYYSILPTATQYARNSFFSGLMPSEIEKRFPNKWFNDNEEGNKNPDYIKMSYDDGTVYFHMKQNQDVDAFVNTITETRVNLMYHSWFRVDFGIIYEGDITKEDSHFFAVIGNYMNSKPYIYKKMYCDSDAIIITQWIDSQQCIMRNFIVTTHDIDSVIDSVMKKFGNGSETWCKSKIKE